MVWFQCEDCGDNLKKPKLPNHFRVCSANRVSSFINLFFKLKIIFLTKVFVFLIDWV